MVAFLCLMFHLAVDTNIRHGRTTALVIPSAKKTLVVHTVAMNIELVPLAKLREAEKLVDQVKITHAIRSSETVSSLRCDDHHQ